jgi:signal transduction histidine kinase
MQNAIDACRLRKMIDGDIYNPEIRVEVDEKYIKFIDNGIGMDEFDIEHYFSKIGESFFNNNKITPEFESIGKYGIGVLSYFLICDWFEVETKKANNDPLKFRVDKITNMNFLFYEETSDITQGTTVKIPINIFNPKIFNVFSLHKVIEDFFVNLEIPVRLEATSAVANYHAVLKFHADFQNQDLTKIKRRVPFPINSTTEEINTKEISIDSENLEGQLYTFYSRDSEDNFKDLSKYNDGISIRLFSKGLRIQKVKSKNLYTLGGFLNFKKNININLNKSQIMPFSKINEILQNWEIQLLKKFWEETSTLTIEEKQEYSIDFYKNVFRGRSFYSDSRSEEYYQFFKETLYPFTFINNQLEIVQLETFLNNNSQFLLTPIMGLIDPSKLEHRIELGELSNRFKLLIPSFETLLLFLEWIYNKKILIKVISGPYLPYLFVDTDQRISHSKLFNTYLVLDFENDANQVFASVYGANSLFKCLLNKNTPFINFICQEENLIDESIKILIKEFFSKIKNTDYPQAMFNDLDREYSDIISRINSNYDTNYNPSFLP